MTHATAPPAGAAKFDGTIDLDEIAIVEGIAKWTEMNKQAIIATRPWKVLGEGPQMASAAPLSAQGFNEGKGKPFTAEDVRFTQSKNGKTLYAIIMGSPTNTVTIKSLGASAALLDKPMAKISLLGSKEKLKWSQTATALTIEAPAAKPSSIAIVFRITLKN